MGAQVRNKDFYQSAETVVTAFLQLINRRISEGMKIPVKVKEKYILESDNSCKIEYEQIIDWTYLYIAIEKDMHSLPQYSACIKVMQADAIISKQLDTLVGTFTSKRRFTADQCIDGLLRTQAVSFLKNGRFDQKKFESDYACIENFFYNEKITVISITPLVNFTSEINMIELNSSLRIRELTLLERSNLINELKIMDFSGLVPRFDIKYVIEYEYLVEKVIGENPNNNANAKQTVNVQEVINKVVTALRLLKQGNVMLDFTTSQYKDSILGGMSYSGFSDSRLLGGIIYDLKINEVNDFKLLWQKINESEVDSVALRRFNYYYLRQNAEDRLIDAMIALEALFLKGEKAGASSGLIISIACSMLIGKTKEEREIIQEKISSAYNLRNKIVHGTDFNRIKKNSKTDIKQDLVHENALEMESLVREAIRKLFY